MSAYAYRLVGNAKTVAADYIPSLIAINDEQATPTPEDIYFEQTAVDYVNLTGIGKTRWATYDNHPDARRDPIYGLRFGSTALYIPRSDLRSLVTDLTDAPAVELIRAFLRGQIDD